MQITLANPVALAALLGTGVQGLGINCRGSAACKKNAALADILSYMSNIQTNRTHKDGEHIAC
jgi:hypothetical protein